VRRKKYEGRGKRCEVRSRMAFGTTTKKEKANSRRKRRKKKSGGAVGLRRFVMSRRGYLV